MKKTGADAEKAGAKAFLAGKARIPAQDLEFKEFLKCKNILEVLTGWLHGWDIANLANGESDDMPSVAEFKRIMEAK